jgi:hypothetical protein
VGLVRVNTTPTPSQLRQFGFIWLGFLSAFGLLAWFKLASPTAAIALWALAVVVPVAGWIAPPVMRAVFVGMSMLAWPVGFVVSHLVLAAVYYLVLTPIGLVMRLVGYDPMRRRSEPGATTFWIERAPDGRGSDRYFRQF